MPQNIFKLLVTECFVKWMSHMSVHKRPLFVIVMYLYPAKYFIKVELDYFIYFSSKLHALAGN